MIFPNHRNSDVNVNDQVGCFKLFIWNKKSKIFNKFIKWLHFKYKEDEKFIKNIICSTICSII